MKQNCSIWKFLLHGQCPRRPRQIWCMGKTLHCQWKMLQAIAAFDFFDDLNVCGKFCHRVASQETIASSATGFWIWPLVASTSQLQNRPHNTSLLWRGCKFQKVWKPNFFLWHLDGYQNDSISRLAKAPNPVQFLSPRISINLRINHQSSLLCFTHSQYVSNPEPWKRISLLSYNLNNGGHPLHAYQPHSSQCLNIPNSHCFCCPDESLRTAQ